MIHEKCLGKGFTGDEFAHILGEQCDRIKNGQCVVYENPEMKWREGSKLLRYCPLATHYDPILQPGFSKSHKVNPLKQSKRG